MAKQGGQHDRSIEFSVWDRPKLLQGISSAAKVEISIMVDVIAKAKIIDIIYAQLSQDADLYNEILEISRRGNITTGQVLNVAGGLRGARLSMPVKSDTTDASPGVRIWEGGLIA